VAHDGHLPAHVLDVDGRPQLALGDGLAGEQLLGVPIHAQVRHPELPAAELPVQDVLVVDPDDLAPLVAQHREPLLPAAAASSSSSSSAGAVPRLVRLLLRVGCGEVRGADVLPRDGGRRAAAVAHGRPRSEDGGGRLGLERHLGRWGGGGRGEERNRARKDTACGEREGGEGEGGVEENTESTQPTEQ